MNQPPSFFAPRYHGVIVPSFQDLIQAKANIVGEIAGGFVLAAGEAGVLDTFRREAFVVRFTAEGLLDTAYANNGLLRLAFRDLSTIVDGGNNGIVLANGAVLIGGWGQSAQYVPDQVRAAPFIVRVSPSGVIDTSFGENGFFAPAESNVPIRAIAVNPANGLIYAVGDVAGVGYRIYSVQADGRPNTSFGQNGQVTVPVAMGPDDYLNLSDLDVGRDGRLYVSWSRTFADKGVHAFEANGVVAAGFGIGGEVKISSLVRSDGLSPSMAIGQDGALLLLAGIQYTGSSYRTVLAKLKVDGTLEASYGDKGIAYGSVDVSGSQGQGVVTVDPNGSALVLMSVDQAGVESGVLARFDAKGRLDNAFGTSGTMRLFLGEQASGSMNLRLESLVLTQDRDLVIGGQTWDGDSIEMTIAKFDSLGNADVVFSGPAGDTSQSSVPYIRGYPAVTLSPEISVVDQELSARKPGGDYGGSSVRLWRSDGAELADGVYAVGRMAFVGDRVLIDGKAVGTFSLGEHELVMLYSSGASESQVNEALRSVAFRTDEALTHIAFDWRFDDGGSGVPGSAPAAAIAHTDLTLTEPLQSSAYWVNSLTFSGTAAPDAVRAHMNGTNAYFVSFPRTAPAYMAAQEQASFVPASPSQIDNVWAVLHALEGIVNLRFVETGLDDAPRTLSYFNARSPEGYQGWAGVPSGEASGSDVSLGFYIDDTTPTRQDVYAHETGHALGLKHPFDAPALPGWEDTQKNTVMSYNRVYEPALADLDIAALQFLYGPSQSSRAGNDTYRLDAGRANFFWDGGGTDTIDGSAIAQPISIHLDPGHWDFIGIRGMGITSAGQITINFGSSIEGFIGGAGSDLVFGNAHANQITGGRGDDVVSGGDGDDTLEGGAGDDHLDGESGNDRLLGGDGHDILIGGAGQDFMDGGPGIDTVRYASPRSGFGGLRKTSTGWTVSEASSDVDSLISIERLEFSDRWIALDLDANAGSTAKVLGAIFGKEYLRNREYVGIGLGLLDGGMSYADLAAIAVQTDVFAKLAGSHSNADFVKCVYRNVTGTTIGQGDLDYFLGLLGDGTYTQATLALMACETAANKTHIDLVGLASTGIDYVPFAGG